MVFSVLGVNVTSSCVAPNSATVSHNLFFFNKSFLVNPCWLNTALRIEGLLIGRSLV